MKKIIVTSFVLAFMLTLTTDRALALSYLPTEMYLDGVVGDEEVVIFEAISLDRTERSEHTVEVLKVTEAKQGWVENKIFAYHQKSHDWGYLCNNGPSTKGSTGVYVATRNDQGQYSVHQRLEVNDPLIARLEANLEAAEVEGGVSEISTNDRMNQIMTSIKELFQQISTLLKEYSYWKSN